MGNSGQFGQRYARAAKGVTFAARRPQMLWLTGVKCAANPGAATIAWFSLRQSTISCAHSKPFDIRSSGASRRAAKAFRGFTLQVVA